MSTDLIVAGSSARFRFVEKSIGMPPFAGGVQRQAERVGRAAATKLVFMSEELSAEQAANLQIVAFVVDDADLAERSAKLARDLANGPTRAHAVTKSLLKAWAAGGVTAADSPLGQLVIDLFDTDDVKGALASAVRALENGTPRPDLDFAGH
jgi:enoyl-CoA hydratase/carnithine racemase